MSELTFIGLDVHARSVAAGVLEGSTGEVRSCAAPVRTAELVEWLQRQGEAVSVAYEAGPTGYGLARACAAAGVPCLVAAPSRIAKAPADRVKTDRRDALRLAKLLRLGELTPVRVPSPAEEGARDLVRAREDARSDLMRARHRSSKLLLRQGLVWEGSTWTAAHERWLFEQCFAERALQFAWEESLAAMLAVKARRDALDAAIAKRRPRSPGLPSSAASLVCAASPRSPPSLWPRRSATGSASTGARSAPTWGSRPARARPASAAIRGRSPRPATATPGASWSRRPGTIGAGRGRAVSWPVGARASRRWCVSVPWPPNGVCTAAGAASTHAASAPRWLP